MLHRGGRRIVATSGEHSEGAVLHFDDAFPLGGDSFRSSGPRQRLRELGLQCRNACSVGRPVIHLVGRGRRIDSEAGG